MDRPYSTYEGVTYVQAAGNTEDGNPVILKLGLAYNVITVGAMHEYYNRLEYYSSYDNLSSFGGCYKPDLIAPAPLLTSLIPETLGGTSSATPVVSGIIALMLELKPSLRLRPEVIKAILLASCHKKATDPVAGIQTEFMTDGLTNKQGAGILDPFVAIDIVSKNQYGNASLYGTKYEDTINITHQSIGGNHMNISLAWLQHNLMAGSDITNDKNLDVGIIQDLDFYIYTNNNPIAGSALAYSSTELAYFKLPSSYAAYQLKVKKYKQNTGSVSFGYAWSTNDTAYNNRNLNGTYYIKNVKSGLYLNVTGNTEGANVVQQVGWKNSNQKFQLKSNGQGYYTIHPMNAPNMVIGIDGEPALDYYANANIELQNNYGYFTGQHWMFIYNGNGSFRIASESSLDKCVMTVQYASTSPGANVFQHSYNATHNDEWILEPCD